jgi:hypothetical protein
MLTTRAFSGFAALMLAATPVAAQDLNALSWLAGSWRGTGAMFGKPSEARLDVQPVLGGRFMELGYRAGGFEGRAFYHPAQNGAWQASWFDNRGTSFSIEAKVEGRKLTANWGSFETERGRTIYQLAPDGKLHVLDEVMQPDGSHRAFATHVFESVNRSSK